MVISRHARNRIPNQSRRSCLPRPMCDNCPVQRRREMNCTMTSKSAAIKLLTQVDLHSGAVEWERTHCWHTANTPLACSLQDPIRRRTRFRASFIELNRSVNKSQTQTQSRTLAAMRSSLPLNINKNTPAFHLRNAYRNDPFSDIFVSYTNHACIPSFTDSERNGIV